MVRTFFGSLPTTLLPRATCVPDRDRDSATAAGPAPGCAARRAGPAAAGRSIGCSSRETSFSLCPRSLTRSVINLLDWASLPVVAGTILLGAVSALITGGGVVGPGEPTSARQPKAPAGPITVHAA